VAGEEEENVVVELAKGTQTGQLAPGQFARKELSVTG
jgi:hypothetical protein